MKEFLTQNFVFWAIVREIISIRLACAGAQEKRQDGRKEEKSQEVYISRMRGATSSGRIPNNLANVFVSRTLSNVQSFIVINWDVSELWGV